LCRAARPRSPSIAGKTNRLQSGAQHHAAQREPAGGRKACRAFCRERSCRGGDQDAGGNFDVTETIRELEEQMLEAANNLEFEKAALFRDQIKELKRSLNDDVMRTPPSLLR